MFELKSTISLFNFNTKNEMLVSVINAIQYDLKHYQKCNNGDIKNSLSPT